MGSAKAPAELPEFWIDVGGTFTDCIAWWPDDRLHRWKVLSSGVVQGAIRPGSTSEAIVDSRRTIDPPGFWTGFRVRLRDADGRTVADRIVVDFDRDHGALQLDSALDRPATIGQLYELSCGEEAPLLGVRYLLGLPLTEPLPPVVMRLGTTRGTNALLTRRGARTAWVTTRGFADALSIGYQSRPRLFDLTITKPEPLYERIVEIDERVSANGQILRPLDEHAVRRQLRELREAGVESLAVCLLHAYRFADHERRIGAIAHDLGFAHVSLSHQVAPVVKLVSRGDTTVVDAYLTPVLREYVATLSRGLHGGRLWAMTSAGSLVVAERFSGKDSILSGPAGGVVGLARVAAAAGLPRVIGFDMGGTSTDVSRYEGRFEREFETEKAGVRVCAPMLAIETVAAGGGSICRFDGVKLIVGPQSAGADPGPACYGRGGPLTITDVNFILGRIVSARFPFPLDRQAATLRLSELQAIVAAAGTQYMLEQLAEGLLRVANATMAQAVRSVSIARGYDPREYVLVPFGGAAGQHACAVARELGIRQVLCHSDAGLLSALGIGLADRAAHRTCPVQAVCDERRVSELRSTFDRLAEEARAQLDAEGGPAAQYEVHRALEIRYVGVEAALLVDEPRDETYTQAFAREHRRRYGFEFGERELEIVTARVEVIAPGPAILAPVVDALADDKAAELSPAHFDDQPQPIPLYDRDRLAPGRVVVGPAIILESASTTVIDPGWDGQILPGGELLLTDQRDKDLSAAMDINEDPILLEVFHQHFAGIAREMGHTLRNTSVSVNVKERLDFSCALFTAGGDLVVNAPHIPVHLGAMSETVRSTLADNPRILPGDVFVTNDPFRGGSHLPDVTVVTPVHDETGTAIRFFVASRAHHAEIGGIVPGSMPPFSRTLADEGVLIRNFSLIDQGQPRFGALAELLRSGPHPSRAVSDNLADVAAQVAANQQGVRDLHRLVARYTWPVVDAYMNYIRQATERKTRQALRSLPPGRRAWVDHLDDGTPVAVTVTREGERTVIDFNGTGPVSPYNFNANRAIVRAAVLYVLRLLIAEDIPLNEGVLSAVEIVLPEGLLNPRPGVDAAHSPAVAAGNVETSQRVVDVLLGALGLAAASQGTMNNLLFGDSSFGYYETICGGSGATAAGPGADAVQTHMTNTRLTDAEVLELRYPVRVREFAVRHGSGGRGRHAGGNGSRRALEFLRPLVVSLVTQRRGPFAPFGLEGAEPGALGRNQLTRADGTVVELSGCVQINVAAGDVLLIETPGGGGWGEE